MIRAVFFDFGGTLMSGPSDRLAHQYSWHDVKRRFHLRRPVSILLQRFEDLSWAADMETRWVSARARAEAAFSLLFFQERRKFPTASELRWFWRNHLVRHRAHTELLPHVVETLEALRALGFHLGIISDIDDDFLEHQLKALGLEGLFDTITSSEEVKVAKPNPAIFRVALRKARCRPEEAVYVGDSVRRDVLGARALGMTPVWIGHGTTAYTRHSVSDLAELVGLLEPGTRTLEFVLASQTFRHSRLAVQDIYKLVFQASLGPGHWHPAEATLRREWQRATGPSPLPPVERVDPEARVFRLNLAPFRQAGGDFKTVVRLVENSARLIVPNRRKFSRLWQELHRLARARSPLVRARALAAFERKLDVTRLPVVHHSARYERTNHPNYVLVARALLPF